MRSIDDIFREFIDDISKNSNKLFRTEVYGLIISSVYTPDCGFETAIIDKNNIYVVERYKNEQKLSEGHKKWCKKAKTLKNVRELSWLGITEERNVVLERDFDVKFPEKHGMYIFKSYKHGAI